MINNDFDIWYANNNFSFERYSSRISIDFEKHCGIQRNIINDSDKSF
jgi:hypothetical protein